MDNNWAIIYSTTDQIRIEVLRGMLEANDIEAIVLNKQDSAYLSFGAIELYVKRENIVKAKYLIQSQNE